MTKKDLILAANLLDLAANVFINHGCNDLDFPSDFSEQDIRSFKLDFKNLELPDEEIKPEDFEVLDFEAMEFLAKKLRSWAKS